MDLKQLQALYGLKYHPFLPNLPVEALWRRPGLDLFSSRIDTLVTLGGFALVSGETGVGKSKVLLLLADHLEQFPELTVRGMERPQSRLGDFYRELGDLFGVNLSPANRYGGFKALRARWRAHIKSSLLRPVLLVDEAQEMAADCLNELRLLGSVHFDSECLLTTVLADDTRLAERLRQRELLPLGSRIRNRWVLEPLGQDELADFLDWSLEQAGAPHIMTDELERALCEHAMGNLRVLCNMATELLAVAAERKLATLDETLFFDVFRQAHKPRQRTVGARRKNR